MGLFFFSNAAVYAATKANLLIGFDGLHLKDETNTRGMFFVATAKDYNNHTISFGLALVPVEHYEHWCWFLDMTKQALELSIDLMWFLTYQCNC